MLKTIRITENKKTGPIAVTYRAGGHSVFGTCPKSCPLNPKSEQGSKGLDRDYLDAVRKAVPRKGQAWTYSHFPAELLPVPAKGETVINASCDTPAEAINAIRAGRPAVLAAATETAGDWPKRIDGTRFIRCPAETSDKVNCANCGGGRPLCARGDRDYVVVFVAHGSRAALVGKEQAGGCYGALGPVALAWGRAQREGVRDDAGAVVAFARSLPSGSLLRHHVVGDLGAAA